MNNLSVYRNKSQAAEENKIQWSKELCFSYIQYKTNNNKTLQTHKTKI